MARIIALDIGGKRTGIAETDPLQMVASPRETVPTRELLKRLEDIFREDLYEAIVIGWPLNLQGGDSDNSARVRSFRQAIGQKFPDKKVFLQDERYSSKRAVQGMVEAGVPKKKRQNKADVDMVSAAIILQDHLSR